MSLAGIVVATLAILLAAHLNAERGWNWLSAGLLLIGTFLLGLSAARYGGGF